MKDTVPGPWGNSQELRHARFYPHPVRRVWEALTNARHLGVWMAARARIDARLGGRFSLTFEGAAMMRLTGTIRTFRPHEALNLRFDAGGYLRFELQTVAGATCLLVCWLLPPGFVLPETFGDSGDDVTGGLQHPSHPRLGGSGQTGAAPSPAEDRPIRRADRCAAERERRHGGAGRCCSWSANGLGVRSGVRHGRMRGHGAAHRRRAGAGGRGSPVLVRVDGRDRRT